MILVIGLMLYLFILPVLVLWFIQARLPKPPTEFEILFARVTANIHQLSCTIGEQIIPAVQKTTTAFNAFAAAFTKMTDG